MSPSIGVGPPGPSSAQIPLDGVIRLVAASPTPALVVGPGDALLGVSESARSRLGLGRPVAPRSAREVLGVGWRELELVAGDGHSDLVVDLPLRPPGGSRLGWRVRPERLTDAEGRALAVVAWLEEPTPGGAAGGATHRPHRQVSFDDLFGTDARMLTTKLAAERFSRTRLPMLLLAETGTGKDLLARAVHFASPRRDRPFVAINCGALSPHLLESELFGYAPGAFTDARREGHDGKIGAARGGTLFLDEVAEMPGPLQALLLRVLEDGTYFRVGESTPRHADVRLICATCRELPLMVEEGAFRQDLFYRIAGVCLGLPPVRERSDVRALVLHVLEGLLAEGAAEGPTALSPEALEWLAAQSWPGNVRQVKTALQYALTLADGAEIRLEHLPPMLHVRSPAPEATRPSPAAGPEAPRTLGELEADLVVRTVEAEGGNLTRAARRLGIARSTLYRHLERARLR
ncbi:MAG TPA: sigma 54-interacting transcriptional regulator [Thermoanaerobaculia bacterium]|nr:sigma 54-interacting transcriptional regulator [Thermoanaerobaculia bacterium]